MSDYLILIADKLESSGVDLLRKSNVQVVDSAGISAGELAQVIGDFHALIVRSRTKVTAELIKAALRLKVIGRAGVGVDNIDLPAAKRRDIVVVNAPTATSLAVAELTLGLMLSLARHIPTANQSMKNGLWLKKSLAGSEICGKTLGIIGMGNIGSIVAQRAAGLGLTVLGSDRILAAAQIAALGANPVSLADLYAHSDYISLHIPLNSESVCLIDEQAINQMKPGVRIICTARGGIIDEAALLIALQSGRVAAAALDVFSQEPPGLSALIQHPNLIATPHIGAQTLEAQKRVAEDVSAEVLSALKGEPLRWRVV